MKLNTMMLIGVFTSALVGFPSLAASDETGLLRIDAGKPGFDNRCKSYGITVVLGTRENPSQHDLGIVGPAGDSSSPVTVNRGETVEVVVWNDARNKNGYVLDRSESGRGIITIPPGKFHDFTKVSQLQADINSDEVPMADKFWFGVACVRTH